PITIGERNFMGNNIALPTGAKIGANCLLATKVMVPIDGPVRENVGLLGSPCFEIPRIVDSDMRSKSAISDEERLDLVAQKTRYNVATMVGYLLSLWLVAATNIFGLV